MTIYLSGKISGLDEKLCYKKFDFAERLVKGLGHDVINPMKLPHEGAVAWENYLANDIIILVEQVDAIFKLYDWEDSLGARLEVCLFEKLGRPVYSNLFEIPHNDITANTQRNRAEAGGRVKEQEHILGGPGLNHQVWKASELGSGGLERGSVGDIPAGQPLISDTL